MSVTVYVEGGGDSAELKGQCRRGFQELLANTGFGNGDGYPILLVDSEDPVASANRYDANPSGAWQHLVQRDRWTRPSGSKDDQAQLMVTTMETWLLADRQTLIAYFPAMSANALPPDADLESRCKPDVTVALRNATQSSGKGRYHKGNHSFDLLGRVEPEELKSRLPHFRRFVETLETRLPPA